MRNFFKVFIVLSVIAFVFILRGNPYPCANSISCANDLTGMYDKTALTATFHSQHIPVPPQIYISNVHTRVLGETTSTTKHIYVDLSKQRLYAFEGNRLMYSFLVSTGLWGRTPTGEFTIWTKLRYTRMKGGSVALGTYYDLPNVPYVMFFYNKEVPKQSGYSIHGTYWHNNFGHPMSHGCVNMKTEEVALLYSWVDSPSMQVTIYGKAPLE